MEDMSQAKIRRWLSGRLIAGQSLDLLRDWTNIVRAEPNSGI